MQSSGYVGSSSTLVSLMNLIRAEGLKGLSRGVIPNIQRGFIVNAAELGSYDHARELVGRLVIPSPN